MKLISPEQLWKRYPNKYLALNVAALDARRMIENMQHDEVRLPRSPYEIALERTVRGELPHARLTEADIAALAREGFEEPGFSRPPSL
ncbi:hypothetical protein FJY69_00310 [candidate division WOR-3 bacterium]|nr:hypothetical protein [candidate division WOR-3 bacterium]